MKTFLLMLGSAFCGALLFAVALWAYFHWQWRAGPETTVHFPARSQETVAVAPPITERERFYGTHATLAGEFSPSARRTVLAAGEGRIAGSVTSSDKPLQGLRLRLALNGAVMSQWATTGADGRYEVSLPYGKYRIDGYELDSSVVNTVLAGKTDGPNRHSYHQQVTVVEAGKPGRGPDFAFVDPVRKLAPSGEVKAGQPVIARWQPYAGASAYRLQLVEQKDPRNFEGQVYLFDWRQRPIVSGTSTDLAGHGAALKSGHYYTVEVEALDERNRTLSQSARRFGEADFRVAE